MPKTILAIGAHYDDCVFGLPGILLQAIRKHHRVVILSLIGDYRRWPTMEGRGEVLPKKSAELAKEHGVEMRFLGFESHMFDVTTPNKLEVAKVVAEVQPDIAFLLWRNDHHDDHMVASQLSEIALRNAGQLLERKGVKIAREMYYYDNGPRHTIGFEADTFVDVSADWQPAIDWLGKLMAIVRNEAYDPSKRDSSQQTKESLARFRGQTCGARYAEAVKALYHAPREIF